MKNGSGATKSASILSRTRVSKAASISSLVLALRICICSPRARAASGTSCNVRAAMGTFSGLTNMAKRTAFGPNLSEEKIVARHISARPSEAGDKALLDGVVADAKHDGDCCGCRFGRLGSVNGTGCGYDSHPTAHDVSDN